MQNDSAPHIFRQIGVVRLAQVQRDPLKIGAKPARIFDPAGLVRVPRLRITGNGVIGRLETGEEVLDVHHPQHPATRNRLGRNGFSIAFTGHYERMRLHFGTRLETGCAGENLIIESAHPYTLEELASGLLVENVHTGMACRLHISQAIQPCAEFSHYAWAASAPLPAAILKETLQFLDGGRRGFFAHPIGANEFIIEPGDRVYLLA